MNKEEEGDVEEKWKEKMQNSEGDVDVSSRTKQHHQQNVKEKENHQMHNINGRKKNHRMPKYIGIY
jgi:hypothetical protein